MAEFIEELAFIFSSLNWLSFLDILLVTFVIFALLALVRGTQAVVLLRGIIFLVVVVGLLITFLDLRAVSWLLRNTLPALIIAIPVIFLGEYRFGIVAVFWRSTN